MPYRDWRVCPDGSLPSGAVRLAIPILCALAIWSGVMLGLRRPRVPWTGLYFGMSKAEVLRARPDTRVPVQGEPFQATYHFQAAGLEGVELWKDCVSAAEKDRIQGLRRDFLIREYGQPDQYGQWHAPDRAAWLATETRRSGCRVSVIFAWR